jgi:hypothetical protein
VLKVVVVGLDLNEVIADGFCPEVLVVNPALAPLQIAGQQLVQDLKEVVQLCLRGFVGAIHFFVEDEVLEQLICVDDGYDRSPLLLAESGLGEALDQSPEVVLVGFVEDEDQDVEELAREAEGREDDCVQVLSELLGWGEQESTGLDDFLEDGQLLLVADPEGLLAVEVVPNDGLVNALDDFGVLTHLLQGEELEDPSRL